MKGRLYLTLQEDMLDLIAWKYYGTSSGTVEEMLEANTHDEVHALSSLPEILPAAQLILLPEMKQAPQEFIQIWQ